MSSYTFKTDTDTDLTHEGQEYNVSFVMNLTIVHDPNADCDADGNRGRDVTYEDERVWTVTKVERYREDEMEPVDLATLSVALAAAIETHLETLEIETPEPDNDEPDYDPIEKEDRRERRVDGPDYD